MECDCQFSVNTSSGPKQVTLKQILMSIKSQSNRKTPLFTGVDVQDDGSILILYHSSLSKEAETIVHHLSVYLEAVFGPVIYQFFTTQHRRAMSQFIYCPDAKRVVMTKDKSDDGLVCSTDSILNSISAGLGVSHMVGNFSDVPKMEFDLPHQFSLEISPDGTGIVGDENRSSQTWRTDLSEATEYLNSDEDLSDLDGEETSSSGSTSTNHTNGSYGKFASYSATGAAPDDRQEESDDA